MKRSTIFLSLLLLIAVCSTALMACGLSSDSSENALTFISNGDGTCYVTGGDEYNAKSIAIPERSPEGDLVTAIADNAFELFYLLEDISIPQSVSYIGKNAFMCGKLKYNEHDNGYYLGNEENPYLFFMKVKNTDITSCSINDKTAYIYDSAFWGCDELTKLTIPNGIKGIGNLSFSVTSKIKTNDLGNARYLGCSENPYLVLISTVNDDIVSCGISDKTRFIANGAFTDCKRLESITIPGNVEIIGDNAFRGCERLSDVTIENGVKVIGDDEFWDCHLLKSIYIPASVKTIGRSALNSPALQAISVDNANANYSSIGGVLYNKEGKTLIQYPRGSETQHVIIPEGVTTIGESAFHCCYRIQSITIPTSVIKIEKSPIYTAQEFTIYYTGSIESWNKIDGVSNICEDAIIKYGS